ncbi:MAG: sigma-54-dependent Fis family transcriptional regulator [Novosphingobium sp. 17-62-19]|uniref:sigma-54 interaction domain-containing protein n=1 Tax=Novosphingobium sp. 17-62-19 TaxID=1970406 RepID=UPI000BC7BABC|nr:sigma 54-interacting transcriptional regulator [Novosphingobium sp. 17-62-19]OYX96730.1 MAG: sigma-54-dependent Fis family transcriptional regulator [Novosphingobium sp. 35-62-5]OZA17019.1 MAG: sigma-54-dependent Fis family transcriptional regulator [Novosphingobium sp. 17-62-19]HQS97392.1 sigma 54-interacting transcriptional regulator [Novosphingobium sp.]
MIRDCGILQFTEAASKAHAALVQRAASVLSSYGAEGEAFLADAFEGATMPPRKQIVLLERAPVPQIERQSGSRIATVRYADGAGGAALAALLACAARPGAPIAADPESLSVLALAERIAASDIPVLINGPTGTGKEVLSRFIHERSARKDKPFIAINCAAMPEAMLEALLFGHQKGSFTGANAASEGFFRAADGGTLLLDEIAEMPLSLQAKLLRVLQEGEVVPLGATQPIKVDVRVIACANRDLPLEVEEGRFRADLFYRLNVFPLALRPLCERPDDIAPLAFAMALRHAANAPWISDEALAMLAAHAWPGNVRELENVVRRALVLAGNAPIIGPEHIAFDRTTRLVSAPVAAPETSDAKLSNIVQMSEARAIISTLEACNGSRVAAARQLGISERTLRYRLASFREAGIAVGGRR